MDDASPSMTRTFFDSEVRPRRVPSPGPPVSPWSGSREGRAALWLLLGLLAVGGLGFWFAGGLPESTGKTKALEPDRSHAVSTQSTDLDPTPNVARMRVLGDPTVSEAPAPTDERRPKVLVRDFNGRGSLAGRATVQAGLDFPKRWTLHLEPSQSLSLAGRERAVTRDIVIEAGEEFEVKDLPLGGYSVSARAPGLNGIPVDVALFKRQEHAYVMLRMTPAGFLDGGVVDAEGVPVDDLLVLLERNEDLTRRETRTDAAGNYIFQDVLDGEYTLYFGSAETPLLPPRQLRFQAPSLRFPTSELPPMASVRLKAVDGDGRALPDVLFRGYGTKNGTIEGTSDAAGEYRARFLPAGRYRVTAYLEKAPRGKVNFDLALTDSSESKVVEISIE